MTLTLVWFRRDLRLTDHPALSAALAAGETVLPVYIDSRDEEGSSAPGAASRWWLARSLQALQRSLTERGSSLVVRTGPALPTLLRLARECGATTVRWNRLYEPALMQRDTAVKAGLRDAGLAAHSHVGDVLFEPWTVRSGGGTPFRVFTPFWKHLLTRLDDVPRPLPAPTGLPVPARWPDSLAVAQLNLAPTIPWDGGLAQTFTPGEDAALRRLEAFLDEDGADYKTLRDRPDCAGTSRLSPALHFGEVSPRQVLTAARSAMAGAGAAGTTGIDAFVREVGWREFAIHILHAFPHTVTEPLDGRFAGLPWHHDPAVVRRWQQGQTGIPLVDAGMRELWHTGWMHNRVRMVVASWLTKNLGQHWEHGARWFHDTLVDADLAANTLGWQWTAGCGADAAPYYRIFNPVLQAERFDPQRAYLRRWLPELARLSDDWIHRPFAAPDGVLARAGVVLGRDYPRTIVEPGASRERALADYATMKAARQD